MRFCLSTSWRILGTLPGSGQVTAEMTPNVRAGVRIAAYKKKLVRSRSHRLAMAALLAVAFTPVAARLIGLTGFYGALYDALRSFG